MGIVSCIVFYVASKIFSELASSFTATSSILCLNLTSFPPLHSSVYLFLIEKVHVVSGTSLPRLKSKMYLLCAFSIALYIVIIVLMVLGTFAEEKRPTRPAN